MSTSTNYVTGYRPRKSKSITSGELTPAQTASASQNRDWSATDTSHNVELMRDKLGEARKQLEAQGKPELPQHSPLPWELSHEYCEGFNIAHEIAPNCGKLCVIANVQYSDVKYQPTREQAKANAKLIVASVNNAHKLAEALRAFLKVVRTSNIDRSATHEGLTNCDAISVASKALADWEKAKQ